MSRGVFQVIPQPKMNRFAPKGQVAPIPDPFSPKTSTCAGRQSSFCSKPEDALSALPVSLFLLMQ